MADFFVRPPTFTTGNFEAMWLKDLKFSEIKDLNCLKRYAKYQEASCIIRVAFALSKWPHLHGPYVVGGCLSNLETVSDDKPPYKPFYWWLHQNILQDVKLSKSFEYGYRGFWLRALPVWSYELLFCYGIHFQFFWHFIKMVQVFALLYSLKLTLSYLVLLCLIC